MLLDLVYSPKTGEPAIYDAQPRFFRARMIEGVIEIPRLDDPRVHA
jgi:hypothetical protein